MSMNKTCPISNFTSAQDSGRHELLVRPDPVPYREQLLESGIVADRVPDRIDFQSLNRNENARRNREQLAQVPIASFVSPVCASISANPDRKYGPPRASFSIGNDSLA